RAPPRLPYATLFRSRDVRDEACEPAQLHAPQPVRQSMDEKRVKTGIAGNDFPGRTRRRVAFEYAGYVFADSGKHRYSRGRYPALSETLVNWSTIYRVDPCRPRLRACPAECRPPPPPAAPLRTAGAGDP